MPLAYQPRMSRRCGDHVPRNPRRKIPVASRLIDPLGHPDQSAVADPRVPEFDVPVLVKTDRSAPVALGIAVGEHFPIVVNHRALLGHHPRECDQRGNVVHDHRAGIVADHIGFRLVNVDRGEGEFDSLDRFGRAVCGPVADKGKVNVQVTGTGIPAPWGFGCCRTAYGYAVDRSCLIDIEERIELLVDIIARDLAKPVDDRFVHHFRIVDPDVVDALFAIHLDFQLPGKRLREIERRRRGDRSPLHQSTFGKIEFDFTPIHTPFISDRKRLARYGDAAPDSRSGHLRGIDNRKCLRRNREPHLDDPVVGCPEVQHRIGIQVGGGNVRRENDRIALAELDVDPGM